MKKNPYIVPITLGCLSFIQIVAIILIFIFLNLSMWLSILLVCLLSIEHIIMFYVVKERIKEIKGGEEDDLSKY